MHCLVGIGINYISHANHNNQRHNYQLHSGLLWQLFRQQLQLPRGCLWELL